MIYTYMMTMIMDISAICILLFCALGISVGQVVLLIGIITEYVNNLTNIEDL